MDFRIKALSLRGSEATQAFHKKADSSMDRHAAHAARDDRKTRSATNLPKHAGGRILRLESGLCKASAEISLDGYRTSEPKQSTILAQKPTPKPKEVSYE